MTDYHKYINALRKCAEEHENDRTSTGHIIVSDLCRDTANLLEELEQDKKLELENKQLKNRCHVLSKGLICQFCEYDCEHRKGEICGKDKSK